MYYRGYLEPIPCPLCGTLNNQVREECRFSGCPLENYCSDEDCGTLNTPAARYCKSCGRPTRFLKAKVFDEELRAEKTRQALIYYHIHGDPDTRAAKKRAAEEALRIRALYDPSALDDLYALENGFLPDDDLPDLPLDPEDIPYY